MSQCTRLVLHVGPVFELPYELTHRKAILMLTLKDTQGVALKIQGVDRKGNPTGPEGLEGVPQWSESDNTVLNLTPSEDGMSCQVASTGKIGTSQVTCSANPKGGTTPATGTLDVNVVAGDTVSINISADAPVEL
jgi:hypothetical protein